MVKWHEEIWTKSLDHAISRLLPEKDWFVDSEIPCKGGKIDLIIIERKRVENGEVPRIAVFEAKKGNERTAFRHSVFYSIFLSKLFGQPLPQIFCGAIAVPGVGSEKPKLTKDRIKNYYEDLETLKRDAQKCYELKCIGWTR